MSVEHKTEGQILPALAAGEPRRLPRRPVVVIERSSGWKALDLRELWHYRELLLILAGRDVKLRYKQTALGIIWVILQPLVATLIFALIFGRFARLPSDGVQYVLFVFAGMLPWNYFSGAMLRGGNSLIGDARLISKVYFPRLLIPLASTAAVLIDFAVSFVVLLLLMALYQAAPSVRMLGLPFFLLLAMLCATGVSLWLSALNVRYRDFVYAMPFLAQVWLYASPVAYATSIIPESWQALYSLNPMVGVIEGFRWALLGRSSLSPVMLLISTLVSSLVFISGAFFFRRVERGFADVI